MKIYEALDAAFVAGRSQTSWEQFQKDHPEFFTGIVCKCPELCQCPKEIKHGETSIMCCNECGKPTEKFWTRE